MEGFYSDNPTLAQHNSNPGNIRTWRDAKGPYPTYNGYVDFIAWASDRFPGIQRDEIGAKGLAEGWRVLKVLIGQYVDGKYGKDPTLYSMFAVYAPVADANHPRRYAEFVAGRLGIAPDAKLSDVIQET